MRVYFIVELCVEDIVLLGAMGVNDAIIAACMSSPWVVSVVYFFGRSERGDRVKIIKLACLNFLDTKMENFLTWV
jgi:hypothetical protein